MNIESKTWKIYPNNFLMEKSSGISKHIKKAPSVEKLAMMTEKQFDKWAREAFHGGAVDRRDLSR